MTAMRSVYWVLEGLLAGRPGPTYAPWDPAELYAGGIGAIISLAEEVPVDDLNGYPFQHYRYAFPPILLSSSGLQKAFIYQALPVWRQLDALLQAHIPTLVHCYAGRDRTGAVLAGYLVLYRSLEPDQAIRHVRQVNPYAMEAEGYADAVRLLRPRQFPDPRTLL